METCGYFVLSSYTLRYDIDKNPNLNNNVNISNNNNNSISLTLSFEKNEKFVFVPNKILNIINPNESKFDCGYYAFMLTREIDDGKDKKNDAIIGLSQNPILSAYKYKMNWELSTIIGPFELRPECEDCCNKWQKETRGIVSKKNRSLLLKKKYKKSLYTNGPINNVILNNTLNDLPFGFRDTINKIDKYID